MKYFFVFLLLFVSTLNLSCADKNTSKNIQQLQPSSNESINLNTDNATQNNNNEINLVLDQILTENYIGQETQNYYRDTWKKYITPNDVKDFGDTICLIGKKINDNMREKMNEYLALLNIKSRSLTLDEMTRQIELERFLEEQSDLFHNAQNSYEQNLIIRLEGKGLNTSLAEVVATITMRVGESMYCPELLSKDGY